MVSCRALHTRLEALLKNLGADWVERTVSQTNTDKFSEAVTAFSNDLPGNRKPDLPPVRYKGRVWIRVGPRRGVASEQEERLLSEKRVSYAHTFDARPCLDARLEDLALDLFQINYLKEAVAPEVLAENHRTLPEQLASLRFLDSRSGCPTHAGVILFGKNPLAWMSGAFLQLVGFSGTTMASDVLWERQLSGDLLTVL